MRWLAHGGGKSGRSAERVSVDVATGDGVMAVPWNSLQRHICSNGTGPLIGQRNILLSLFG